MFFMPSLLIRRSTFFVLSSSACQKRTMKDRSSTPPLHVHVDENTPVHVHIKKLPKPAAASSQVGACQGGQVKAAEQGDASLPSLPALLTPKVRSQMPALAVRGQLPGQKVGRAGSRSQKRLPCRAGAGCHPSECHHGRLGGRVTLVCPSPQKSHKRGMKGDTVNVRRSVRVKTKVPWMPPGKSSARHVGCKWEVGSLLFRLFSSDWSGSS